MKYGTNKPQATEFILRDNEQKIIIYKTKHGFEVRYNDNKRGDHYKLLEVYQNVVIY